MANKKFSEFTLKTDTANVDFVVGYDGTDNVRIDPANISGATNLNELTDCLVDTDSLYVGEVPSGLSGNPQDNTILGIDSGTALTSGNSNTLIGNNTGAGISTGSGFTVVGKDAGNGATYTGSNVIMLGYNVEASSATVSNEITLGDSNITSFRIPGIQSGASDGDVLTYNASAGKLELQSGGGGGGLTPYSIPSGKNAIYAGFVPTSVTGSQNVVLSGGDTGTNLTTGQDNILIGYRAGVAITTSLNNVCIGSRAGQGLTTIGSGFSNTVIGAEAGGNTSSASTAIGWLAGNRSNTVSVGDQAGRSASGSANLSVHIGSNAGYSNSGSTSVIIGGFAARNNSTDGHTSIGYQAGYSNTSGSANTNLGYQAGYSNTTNGENVNVGYNAGKTATGSQNVAVGRNAFGDGFGHSGTGNVAMGYLALSSPSGSSNYNVAIGSEALKANGTKSNNVGIGYQSMVNNISGGNNTAVGKSSLSKNPFSGSFNVAFGVNTGGTLENGSGNTMVGSYANVSSVSASNQNSFGYDTSCSANNQVTLGNSSITALRCAVTSITSLSDERDKTDIKDLGYGLAFIDALQPREFVWNNRPEIRTEYDDDGNETQEEFYSANKGKKDFGFIAQEVKELDNDTLRLVYDENPDKLELSYGKLVPVLVQAIKELKAEIELLKS